MFVSIALFLISQILITELLYEYINAHIPCPKCPSLCLLNLNTPNATIITGVQAFDMFQTNEECSECQTTTECTNSTIYTNTNNRSLNILEKLVLSGFQSFSNIICNSTHYNRIESADTTFLSFDPKDNVDDFISCLEIEEILDEFLLANFEESGTTLSNHTANEMMPIGQALHVPYYECPHLPDTVSKCSHYFNWCVTPETPVVITKLQPAPSPPVPYLWTINNRPGLVQYCPPGISLVPCYHLTFNVHRECNGYTSLGGGIYKRCAYRELFAGAYVCVEAEDCLKRCPFGHPTCVVDCSNDVDLKGKNCDEWCERECLDAFYAS